MRFFRRKKKTPPDKEAAATQEAAQEQPSGEEQAPQTEPTPAATAAPEEPAAPEAQAKTETGSDQPSPAEPEAEAKTEADDQPAPEVAKEKRPGFLGRLARRLGKTKDKLSGSIDRITLGKKIDDEVLDELEEVLVTADLGVKTTLELIDGLRERVRRKELADAAALKEALRQGVLEILEQVPPPQGGDERPRVILVVGVNGVGKTTTIGKLAHHFQSQGRKVLLAAGDTFRAAAGEQLEVWAQRVGAELVRQKHGADPSAVAYDAVEAALGRGCDMVIIDTAGRLHTKVNLMEELKKIHRVVGKRLPGAPHEVILVLDATTGQNALSQAKLFNQAVPLTGVILTKLDGTAKGGIVVAIAAELKLPILFVGLGEGMEDLRPFDAKEFAAAIF